MMLSRIADNLACALDLMEFEGSTGPMGRMPRALGPRPDSVSRAAEARPVLWSPNTIHCRSEPSGTPASIDIER